MKRRKPIQRTEEEFERRKVLVMESVDKYYTYLERYLISLCNGNTFDADDLLQELFIHVLLQFEENHISSVGFLRRKAYQLFCDFYRKRKRDKVVAVETLPETLSISSLDAEPATDEEIAHQKSAFFDEFPGIDLTDIQKDIIWRSCRLKYTYSEIAETTGIPTSTISDWIKDGKSKLTDYINSSK